MSSDIAIRVENLSKRYRIGMKDEIHDTFAGALTSFIRSPAKNMRRLRRMSRFVEDDAQDIIWALKDVSFEVKTGEVVGIIGRNGAGKSTLLKILSRITEPTSGRAEICGRVSSLLEVGTGFHPELTGRENVYLNGTILGMRKGEIDHKLDQIVDFSGVEKFIDTPVKFYSSGMQVRLAFSVAAHLEPNILLIDEVLAVGDIEFQKKCLGKMENVAESGRTILFVSHQMEAVEALCNRVVLFEHGKLALEGNTNEVVSTYINRSLEKATSTHLGKRVDRTGQGEYRAEKIWITNSSGNCVSTARPGDSINIHLLIKPSGGNAPEITAACSLSFKDRRGNYLFTLSSKFIGKSVKLIGETELRWTIDELPLTAGDYKCNVYISYGSTKSVIDFIPDAYVLSVAPADFFGIGKVAQKSKDRIFVKQKMEIIKDQKNH